MDDINKLSTLSLANKVGYIANDKVYYGDIPVGALCGRIESKDVPSPTLVILTLA
jgi:hypothetical protein